MPEGCTSVATLLLFCSVSVLAVHAAQLQQEADGKARPSFLVIVTDDQGWDDIGLNNPRYVKTPNIDRFIRSSTFFDNFYVEPQCAQSRAALLTGRSNARYGTMLVNSGWDLINPVEATAGTIFQAAGYGTSQFGKWAHSSQLLGYEPWHAGFQTSYVRSKYEPDMLIKHNGVYEPSGVNATYRYAEQALMSKVIAYVADQAAKRQPYFMYYAPRAIHTSPKDLLAPGVSRFSPPEYLARYMNDPVYKNLNVPNTTIQAWSALDYLDSVLGRLFNYLQANNLYNTTYVLLLSDNGSAMLPGEASPAAKLRRMPSKMQGAKSTVYEGGIRNFLAVMGPGVPQGVTDSTLLHITDVLPTIADIAGLENNTVNNTTNNTTIIKLNNNKKGTNQGTSHLPWDGFSFKNLLVPYAKRSNAAAGNSKVGSSSVMSRRGTRLASLSQKERYLVTYAPNCWHADAVPELTSDRRVVKPQALLSFAQGGLMRNSVKPGQLPDAGRGILKCVAVRYKDYKWLGSTGQLFRFKGSTHIELPEYEVPKQEAKPIIAKMSAAAKAWWTSIVQERHSFEKATLYVGLGKANVSNLFPMYAHDRTAGNVTLVENGVKGFYYPGDRLCIKVKVVAAGAYEVVMMYTSAVQATFKVSFGPYAAIKSGTAPSITAQLPVVGTMQGMSMGTLVLPASGPMPTEACLELVSSTKPGQAVFTSLGNIQLVTQRPGGRTPPAAGPAKTAPTGRDQSSWAAAASAKANPPMAKPVGDSSIQQQYALLLRRYQAQAQKASNSTGQTWDQIKKSSGWIGGQQYFESMYSPLEIEGGSD